MKRLFPALLICCAAMATAGPAEDRRFEECRQKLIKAQELQVLQDMKIERNRPVIHVGPTFKSMPIDAKQGFADTLNCFLLAGDAGKFMQFDLLDGLTGKTVASYRDGKLIMK